MNVLDLLSTMPDTTESTLPLLRVEGLSHAFRGQQVLQKVAVELRRDLLVRINSKANVAPPDTLLTTDRDGYTPSFELRITIYLVKQGKKPQK